MVRLQAMKARVGSGAIASVILDLVTDGGVLSRRPAAVHL